MAYIDNFKTSSVPSASSNDDDERKIFVGGLSWGTTEDDLKEYFSRYGGILDCVLKVDASTGRSRGFGFVLFEDAATVDEVLAQTHILQGRTITPRKARKGREPILKVFVGGVDPAVPERSIWDHFGAYGKVVDLDLPYDRNKGCRRAFCFVTFETEEAVNAVCKDEKQKLGDKYVDVKRATPKNTRNGGFFPRGGYAGGRGGGGSYGGYGNSYQGNYAGYNTYGNSTGYGTSGAYGGGNGGYGSSTYGGMSTYGAGRMGSAGRSSSGRGGGGYSSRGYSQAGYSTGQGEWGRQSSNPSYSSGYGYYNNNYNNNYDGYD